MIESLTGILVIVTGIYCWLTFKILKSNERAVNEMRVQNESIIRPYITINTFVTPGAKYYLKIKNTGNSAALNLKMTLDKNFFIGGHESEKLNIKNAFVFNNNIEIFPPNSELFYFLGYGTFILGEKIDEQKTPQEFTITADYQFHDNSYSENTKINLKQYKGIVIYSESVTEYLKEIANRLVEIKNQIK